MYYFFLLAMTTAAPLRSARANAPPATPVDGFVFEAFEAAFELLSDLLSEDELSEAELLVSDEASELLTLSGCEEAGVFFTRFATASFIAFTIASTSACSVMFFVLSIAARAFSTSEKSSNHFGISPSDPPAGVPADAL